jgi:RNA polymerase sigma-70 factor (ECF subfamily)
VDHEHDALAEVYRRHGGAVWAVARRVCGNGPLAEQVCERVFTELWSRPGRLDPSRRSLRAWLVARAHAGAVEVARSARATDPTPPSAEVEVAEHAATLTGDARRALDHLPNAERDAILLAYLGGHSSRETARLLGESEDRVRRHLRRGLENLRQASDTKGVTP